MPTAVLSHGGHLHALPQRDDCTQGYARELTGPVGILKSWIFAIAWNGVSLLIMLGYLRRSRPQNALPARQFRRLAKM